VEKFRNGVEKEGKSMRKKRKLRNTCEISVALLNTCTIITEIDRTDNN
jgi:hypothetical protein